MSDGETPPNRHAMPDHVLTKLRERFAGRCTEGTNSLTEEIYYQGAADAFDELFPALRALGELVEGASHLSAAAYEEIGCKSVALRSAVQEARILVRQYGVGEAESD